jgi:hypothetical protein
MHAFSPKGATYPALRDQANERVKQSLDKHKVSRKGAKYAKETKEFRSASLCGLCVLCAFA